MRAKTPSVHFGLIALCKAIQDRLRFCIAHCGLQSGFLTCHISDIKFSKDFQSAEWTRDSKALDFRFYTQGYSGFLQPDYLTWAEAGFENEALSFNHYTAKRMSYRDFSRYYFVAIWHKNHNSAVIRPKPRFRNVSL